MSRGMKEEPSTMTSPRPTYERLTIAMRALDPEFPQEEAWRRIEAKAVESATSTASDFAEYVYELMASGLSAEDALTKMERGLR